MPSAYQRTWVAKCTVFSVSSSYSVWLYSCQIMHFREETTFHLPGTPYVEELGVDLYCGNIDWHQFGLRVSLKLVRVVGNMWNCSKPFNDVEALVCFRGYCFDMTSQGQVFLCLFALLVSIFSQNHLHQWVGQLMVLLALNQPSRLCHVPMSVPNVVLYSVLHQGAVGED